MVVSLYFMLTCANNLCDIVVKNLMVLVSAMFRLAKVLIELERDLLLVLVVMKNV